MHMGVYAYGGVHIVVVWMRLLVVCMHECGCIWVCRRMRVCAYESCVYAYVVYAYGEVCVYEYGVMCMHCQASQKSLVVLVLLLLLGWTPADPLCCCCGDFWVGSILPSWMTALLDCVLLTRVLQFCCHVDAVAEAVGDCSLLRPPAIGKICPSSACQSPARPESGLRSPDRLVCCGSCLLPWSLRVHLSVSSRLQSMAKVCTSVGFVLPASSFMKTLKSIGVYTTVLPFRHRPGAIRV